MRKDALSIELRARYDGEPLERPIVSGERMPVAFCSTCGKPMEADAVFCPFDGDRLNATTTAAPVALGAQLAGQSRSVRQAKTINGFFAVFLIILGVAILAPVISAITHDAQRATSNVSHKPQHQAHVAAIIYPPFTTEANAEVLEQQEVQRDLPAINTKLNAAVFETFTVRHASGLAQFDYVVNKDEWDGLTHATRSSLVEQGGPIFNESDRIWRRYHRGKVCLPDPDDVLMPHIVDHNFVDVGIEYDVFVDTSAC